MPANTSSGATGLLIDHINPGDTVDVTVDCLQLEKGAFATSYIPTTTTAVTRNADVVTVPTTGWNTAAGTFIGVMTPSPANYGSVVGWGASYQSLSLANEMGSYWMVDYVQSGTYHYSSIAPPIGYAVWAGTWNTGGPVLTYMNNIESSRTTDNYVLPVGGLTASTANIGYTYGAMTWGAPIQRLIVYNSALSSGNVSTVTSAVQNGP
jgi:hypothetical protein